MGSAPSVHRLDTASGPNPALGGGGGGSQATTWARGEAGIVWHQTFREKEDWLNSVRRGCGLALWQGEGIAIPQPVPAGGRRDGPAPWGKRGVAWPQPGPMGGNGHGLALQGEGAWPSPNPDVGRGHGQLQLQDTQNRDEYKRTRKDKRYFLKHY